MLQVSRFFFVFFLAIQSLFASCLLAMEGPNELDRVTTSAELLKELELDSDDTTRIRLYFKIGAIYFSNQPDSAFYYYSKGLDLSKHTDRQDLIALGFSNIGSVYWQNGNLNEAIKNVLISTEIYENLGDRLGLARSYGNIGTLYYSIRNLSKAMEFTIKALDIYEELGKRKMIALCYNNLGSIYLDRFDDQALQTFMKCKTISEEIDDKDLISYSYCNIGAAYNFLRQYKSALIYLNQSISMFEELNDKSGIATALNLIADVYIEQNRYAESIEYSLKSLTLSNEFGSLSSQSNACISLSKAYEKEGDYENAFSYLKRSNAIKDSLSSLEGVQKMFEFQMQYDVEQSINEIQVLKKDNEIIRLAYDKQKQARNLLIIGTFLLIVLAVVTYLLLYEKRKANKALVKTNLLIRQQSDKLSAAYQKLEDQKSNLELIVGQRTEELRKAKTLAEESNDFKSAILRNVSHEIRTPLNAIMGFSLFLCEDDVTKEDKDQYIELISQGTNELTNVIDNLIEISSLEAQDYILLKERFLLSDIVSPVVKEMHDRLKDGVEIICESKSLEFCVESDKRKLRNIVSQVLGNAANFTEQGLIKIMGTVADLPEITIPAEFGYSLPDGEYLVLEIEDSGIGIRDDQRLKIYDTFHKIEVPSSILYRGMGLGLSISKRLVEIMDGALYHVSKPEGGTSFFIVVPFEKC
ncbi:MAG: tetratricopeptide repeat protein [Salinivirgaceae bacterium]|nr:tetratricopeptide repeat protein [Salinivirgaceae bacterium]MDD4747511.1 tetratricopeptide repeat protein [Salinivirgaceae bacterium]MDY0280966.1 tetratricopeptide repeat protein [Salinivirgaceae bacterium]